MSKFLKMGVGCILLIFDDSEDLVSNISKLCNEINYLKFSFFIIVNNYNSKVYHYSSKRILLNCVDVVDSNIFYEFSGYEVGINYYLNLDANDNVRRIYIFNDTVYKHGRFRFSEKISIFLDYYFYRFHCQKKYDIAGFFHSPDSLLNTLDILVPYFNSKFFIVSKSKLTTFVDILKQSKGKVILDNDFVYQSTFGIKYNFFLKEWLHGSSPNRWYKASVLTDKNRNFFQAKASCIFMEHNFSLGLKKNENLILKNLKINEKLIHFIYKLVKFLLMKKH